MENIKNLAIETINNINKNNKNNNIESINIRLLYIWHHYIDIKKRKEYPDYLNYKIGDTSEKLIDSLTDEEEKKIVLRRLAQYQITINEDPIHLDFYAAFKNFKNRDYDFHKYVQSKFSVNIKTKDSGSSYKSKNIVPSTGDDFYSFIREALKDSKERQLYIDIDNKFDKLPKNDINDFQRFNEKYLMDLKLLKQWFFEFNNFIEEPKRIFNNGRQIQFETVNSCLNNYSEFSSSNIKKDEITYGIFLPCRCGKTAIVLNIIKKTFERDNSKRFFIYTSYRKESPNQLYEEKNSWEEFKNFIIISFEKNSNKISDTFQVLNNKSVVNIKKYLDEHKDTPVIFCCTVQSLIKKEKLIKNKIDLLKNFNICSVFYDEAHYGIRTENCNKVNDEIKINYLNNLNNKTPFYSVSITATPNSFNAVKTKDHYIYLSEYDRQSEKLIPNNQWETIPFISFCGFDIKNIVLKETNQKYSHIHELFDKKNLKNFLSNPDEHEITTFLRKVFLKKESIYYLYTGPKSFNYKDEEILNKLNIICSFSMQTTIKFIEAIANFLNNNSEFNQKYEFVPVSCKNKDFQTGTELENKLKDINATGKIGVVFSCSKFQQSATIPSLGINLRFDNIIDVGTYIQGTSRILNPYLLENKIPKEHVYVVDYNFSRMLMIQNLQMKNSKLYLEYIKMNKNKNKIASEYTFYRFSTSLAILFDKPDGSYYGENQNYWSVLNPEEIHYPEIFKNLTQKIFDDPDIEREYIAESFDLQNLVNNIEKQDLSIFENITYNLKNEKIKFGEKDNNEEHQKITQQETPSCFNVEDEEDEDVEEYNVNKQDQYEKIKKLIINILGLFPTLLLLAGNEDEKNINLSSRELIVNKKFNHIIKKVLYFDQENIKKFFDENQEIYTFIDENYLNIYKNDLKQLKKSKNNKDENDEKYQKFFNKYYDKSRWIQKEIENKNKKDKK